MNGVGIGWRQAHERQLFETRPPLGFIEVHSENFFSAGGAARGLLLKAREHYDVSLHGVGLALGSVAGLDAVHLDRLAALVQEVQPVRVSDHASFARLAAAGSRPAVHAADLLPIAFNEATLRLMVAHVQQVQERLARPLLVENLSAYLRREGSTFHEAEFFNQLARRSGCQLLLDVNNLVVNALNDGAEDPAAAACAWIDRLSLGIVGEIHLAGYDDSGSLVIDDHGSRVREPVWAVYQHALRRLGACPALVEWDTHLPAWEVLIGEAAKAASLQAGLFSPATSFGEQALADGALQAEEAAQQALWARMRALGLGEAAPRSLHLSGWTRLPGPRRALSDADDGFSAYRRNAGAIALRALEGVYPVLARLVGPQAFAALAQRLWRDDPPEAGDLGLWGDRLPDLVESLPELAEEAYLPDVARLEWLLHVARSAADGARAPEGLSLLASQDPASLRLTFQPGFALLRSAHPVVSIWQAHGTESPGGGAEPDEASHSLASEEPLERARAMLALGLGEVAIVRREGWRVCIDSLPIADEPFTSALLQGQRLGLALAQTPPPEFEPWLLRALRQGWLRAVEALATVEEETVS
jgi:uncharacterized protein (UPF0276 family)